MTMLKASFALIFISWASSSVAFGQCDSKIEYSIKKNTEANYSVYIKSNEQLNKVKVQLYDLNQGIVVEEKTINIFPAGEIEVFTNVKSSVYSINFRVEGCDKLKSLGGINGINIGIR